jgi:hypothetical protein
MAVVLWSPLILGALWIVFIRLPGRHVVAVRVAAGVACGVVIIASLVVVIDEIARPSSEMAIVVKVAVIAAGAAVGLAGVLRWGGRAATVLRWAGLVVIVALPAIFFDAGVFAAAAGLFYVPALQPARRSAVGPAGRQQVAANG